LSVWEGVDLPGFVAPLVAVTPQRRDALTAHLESVAPMAEHAADRPLPNDAPARPDDADRAAAACAACGGYCCRNGRDSAYLDAAAIAGVQKKLPHLARDQLVATYVDAVPDKSFEGSCIFHTAHGCNLPRGMRSPVCLAYYCGPLKEWLAGT
jgi:hypothetical protein